MAQTLTVKTDASYKPDVGFTVAYNAEVYIGGEPVHHFSDSKYIDRPMKSTDAEVVGVAYGIVESWKKLEGRVDNFALFLECDCEHAVDVYSGDKRKVKKKLHQTLEYFLDDFNSWRINWISRRNNQKANSLAKTRLRRAEDQKLCP